MQKISLLLFLMIQICQVNAQIDSLITEDEVKDFIKTLPSQYRIQLKKITELTEVDNYSEPFDMDLCQKTAEELGLREAFYKEDFDGNGLTDILLLGRFHGISALVVLSMDDGTYTYHNLSHMNQEGCIYPVIIHQDQHTLIELTYQKRLTYRERNLKKYQPEEFYATHNDELITQSYIFRHGELIEYNPNPIRYDIEKIAFSTRGCYGSCPVFKLTINESRQAELNAIRFNRTYDPESQQPTLMEGLYLTDLSPERYEKLIDQINYLDFPTLKDNYTLPATDQPSSTLTITYGDGQVKAIQDYGKNGTFGLRNLYITLTKLRFDLPWELQSKPAENSSELN